MLASDAFFPFSWNDSVEIACKAGVAAIVHPGGSVRLDACCLLPPLCHLALAELVPAILLNG